MSKIAQIIVDVPLMQTDKPFSYLVPEHLTEFVALGSRVHVPFGNGNRLLQGFVVGFLEKGAQDLKAVVDVLDFEPVLNQEQLDLADAMRRTVFSYKISLLKAMLPSLLNSQYDKVLTAKEDLSIEDKQAIFGQRSSISVSTLDKTLENRIARLVKAGKIQVDYLATDKKHIKTERHYRIHLEQLSKADLGNRAKKRLELQQFLLAHPKDGKIPELNKTFSSPVVNFFIDKGFLEVYQVEQNRSDDYFSQVEETAFLKLNAQQQEAVCRVTEQIGKDSKPFLLQGITGSGKTEVYLHIIDKVLKLGKTAIVLVPEISLTPQMTQRFISRFGKRVAIMHSGLSDGEKFDEWRKVKSGSARVVVGARSAIFAPLENIGAIIIDEEHEAIYKQESNPRYHARDVALLRANYHKAALVLGSATPTIESRARASKDVYQLLQLTQRANPLATVPSVQVVDFRDFIGRQEAGNFTPILLDKIRERLSRKEQVVLMLNRRGYSSFIMCRDCAYVDNCPNCDISLTLHMDTKTMNCHYCGHQAAIPRTCPNCQSRSIRYYGTGTQKAFDELSELLPEARILRMDVDTTRQKGAHQKILETFGNGQADILLGTQMIAKGLDFPNVTLVGVLNADTSLNLPDFRAAERSFQLLTQVAGRAGRAEKTGEVIIQTYNPNHYAIAFAKNQDYEGFYQYEMNIRRQLSYPPYYFTVGISLSHKSEEEVIKKSYEVLALLRQQLSSKVIMLGPTPKAIARTHNLYHYQLIIKYRFEDQLELALNGILDWSQETSNKELRIAIDHEPQNMM
ncbi:primosomal protein N' [Streptococcus plurextorum]|uniref:primosomal protein N' n=1 Tax=Streptococcus plurextorum TaxID=456876 RepID=UPI00041FE45A|nr:primosomal protein N' [Streptococcus plurextorum]